MEVSYRVVNPSVEFLLGIQLNDGFAENVDTGERTEVNMFTLGFFVFEISFIWG